MALVLPLLVMLLLGVMEFGYAFFMQSNVAGAARVAVRYYAINWSQSQATAQSGATSAAKAAVPDPNAATVTFPSPCTGAGQQTTVVVTYQYHTLTGLFDGLLGSNVTITGKGSMACGG